MQDIAHQHCLNHPAREAVAICLECRHCYCRECVTEHDERVICATCLRNMTRAQKATGHRLGWLKSAGVCVGGWMLAMLFFYAVGQILLSLPSSFHDGTIWMENESGQE